MKIGIIGLGNLGRSLAEGLIKSESAAPCEIFICDNSPETRATAENHYQFNAYEDINQVIMNSDVIFLTVKSYVFDELSKKIENLLLRGKTVVSFMAGVSIERLKLYLPDAVIVRAMPSLAISVCDGVIGYTAAPSEVEAIFHKLGYAFETPPENIDKVMAFASCGLGFAAYLIDAFAATGLTMGFSEATCAEIAAKTFKNAIELGGFRDTVKAVATPGGATEQGILHMDKNAVYDIVSGAVMKAYEKMK